MATKRDVSDMDGAFCHEPSLSASKRSRGSATSSSERAPPASQPSQQLQQPSGAASRSSGGVLAPTFVSCEIADYECSICLSLLVDPVVGLCGHDFCKSCLSEWRASSSKGLGVSCPACRQLAMAPGVQTIGVCVRLQRLIEKAYPERSAERRREVEARTAEQGAARQLAIDAQISTVRDMMAARFDQAARAIQQHQHQLAEGGAIQQHQQQAGDGAAADVEVHGFPPFLGSMSQQQPFPFQQSQPQEQAEGSTLQQQQQQSLSPQQQQHLHQLHQQLQPSFQVWQASMQSSSRRAASGGADPDTEAAATAAEAAGLLLTVSPPQQQQQYPVHIAASTPSPSSPTPFPAGSAVSAPVLPHYLTSPAAAPFPTRATHTWWSPAPFSPASSAADAFSHHHLSPADANAHPAFWSSHPTAAAAAAYLAVSPAAANPTAFPTVQPAAAHDWRDPVHDACHRQSMAQSLIELFHLRRPAMEDSFKARLPRLVRKLEDGLYFWAQSLGQYNDPDTLEARVQGLVRQLMSRQAQHDGQTQGQAQLLSRQLRNHQHQHVSTAGPFPAAAALPVSPQAAPGPAALAAARQRVMGRATEQLLAQPPTGVSIFANSSAAAVLVPGGASERSVALPAEDQHLAPSSTGPLASSNPAAVLPAPAVSEDSLPHGMPHSRHLMATGFPCPMQSYAMYGSRQR